MTIGEAVSDKPGDYVALAADGVTLAIGAPVGLKSE